MIPAPSITCDAAGCTASLGTATRPDTVAGLVQLARHAGWAAPDGWPIQETGTHLCPLHSAIDTLDYVIGQNEARAVATCRTHGIDVRKAMGARSAPMRLFGRVTPKVLLAEPWDSAAAFADLDQVLRQVQAVRIELPEVDA